jgi:hypothetical protein
MVVACSNLTNVMMALNYHWYQFGHNTPSTCSLASPWGSRMEIHNHKFAGTCTANSRSRNDTLPAANQGAAWLHAPFPETHQLQETMSGQHRHRSGES